jgi:lipid A 3-O-deacylase
MDGTYAALFFLIGLGDTYLNQCDSGCFAQSEAQARIAAQISDTYFGSENIGQELYLTYDLPRNYGVFQPVVGVSLSSDADVWFGGGAKWTTENTFDGPVFVELSFLPGVYLNNGGPDLGLPLEFRGGIGIGYRFDDGSTLSLVADHRSNGGLGRVNPGLETIGIRFALAQN